MEGASGEICDRESEFDSEDSYAMVAVAAMIAMGGSAKNLCCVVLHLGFECFP
jgi:hypothetical protein